MKEYSFSSIDSDLVAKCHELNEKNVPNVGSRSLEGLTNSIENSDYNEAIVFDNKVIGFVVCFQDNDLTCLLYTSPSPRDKRQSRMPSSA